MKFAFKNSPEWFTNYVTETYVDEFHQRVKDVNWDYGHRNELLDAAVEFFSEKGYRVYCFNSELWFDLDETQEITMLALQWA
jgi:hypothetical protein